MHVAYDHQAFSWQEYGGISRYFWELAIRMETFWDREVSIVAPLYVNRYLDSSAGVKIFGRRTKKIRGTTALLRAVNTGLTGLVLKRLRPGVVHETYYCQRRLAPKSAATVVTVFDMTQEMLPEFFSGSNHASLVKSNSVRRADHVICISENTRRDLIDLFGVAESKTSVVHLGCSLVDGEYVDSERIVREPYIAYVGFRGAYKNFTGLLKAYLASSLLRSNFKIVCFGGPNFSQSELDEIHRLGIPEGSVIPVSGDDGVLANVYRHADVFVCPSHYEGFGLTPLEAMSFGCPVACSNVSSLPEVCGDAAAYFDPKDHDSIRSTVEKVLDSDEHRAQLIRRGSERVREFSWEKCANLTSSLYSSL